MLPGNCLLFRYTKIGEIRTYRSRNEMSCNCSSPLSLPTHTCFPPYIPLATPPYYKRGGLSHQRTGGYIKGSTDVKTQRDQQMSKHKEIKGNNSDKR